MMFVFLPLVSRSLPKVRIASGDQGLLKEEPSYLLWLPYNVFLPEREISNKTN